MFAVLLFQRSRLVRAEAAWYDPSLADGCSLLLDPDMGELFRMACVDDFLRQGIWLNLGARMPLKCPSVQKIQVFSKVIFRAWHGEFFQRSGVPAHIVSLSLFVSGFHQFLQPIVRREALHVWHSCGDDLVFRPSTRTVFLVTIFFVVEDVGCSFLTARRLRQHVENNLLTAKLEVASQLAWGLVSPSVYGNTPERLGARAPSRTSSSLSSEVGSWHRELTFRSFHIEVSFLCDGRNLRFHVSKNAFLGFAKRSVLWAFDIV